MGSSKETLLGDFPGGPAVKNPSANVRDEGSIPGQGTKIPHASGQLSPFTAAGESLYTATKIQHNQQLKINKKLILKNVLKNQKKNTLK